MRYRNRLSELRGNMSQKEFAEKIGLTQQNYWNYENGKQGLRSDLVVKICEMFECTAEWLLCMDLEYRTPFTYLPKGALALKGVKTASVPVRGFVHAGIMTDEDVIEGRAHEVPASIVAANPGCYGLIVEGDCMDRVYPEGCLVVVAPSKFPQNGSIVCIEDENYQTVMRRFYKGANTLILSPDSYSAAHEDIVLRLDKGELAIGNAVFEDGHTYVQLGVVVWFQAAEEME